jgi:hypothetical protein
MEPSAQIKMCAQTVMQFVFNEINSVEYPLVFNCPNYLDNSNFSHLYVF